MKSTFPTKVTQTPATATSIFETEPESAAALARGLSGLLADTYVLFNTTQVYHWNIEGPQFAALHEMFEQQYRDLSQAIDMIAERIRSVGFYADGTLGELLTRSRLVQETGVRDSKRMLGHLAEGHQQIAHRIRELQGIAEARMDEATIDMLIERLRIHEKTVWMLHSQAGVSSRELVSLGQPKVENSKDDAR